MIKFSIGGFLKVRAAAHTLAVLIWEIPYHDARYMPHQIGMNVVRADNSAQWVKGNLQESDWWVNHSKEGWDR